MTIPGGAGTTHPPVLGTPAFIMGSELPRWLRYGTPALRFAPVLCRYNRPTSSGEEGKGLGFRSEAPALFRALSRPATRCYRSGCRGSFATSNDATLFVYSHR